MGLKMLYSFRNLGHLKLVKIEVFDPTWTDIVVYIKIVYRTNAAPY